MPAHLPRILLALITLVCLVSCGGGGAASPSPTQSQASGFFTITAQPAAVTIPPGTTGDVKITIHSLNGFNGAVAVSATTLPAGVIASPSAFTATISQGTDAVQIVSLTASPSATGSGSAAFTADGNGVHNLLPVTVQMQAFGTFLLKSLESQMAVRLGSSSTITISPAAQGGGFLLDYDVLGLPAGVTASFSANPASYNEPVTMTLTAASNAALIQNTGIQVRGTRHGDNAQALASLFLDVAPPLGQTPPNRSDYLRTDGNSSSGVFDSVHKLLFVNNRQTNSIDVISSETRTRIRRIPVPAPAGIDLSIDGKTLLVGTWTRQLYTIDTQTLQVTHSYVLPTIGNSTIHYPTDPVQLASGKLLVITREYASTGSILALWDLATGTSTMLLPGTSFDSIKRSGDGRKVLVAESTSPGTLAVFDALSETFVQSKDIFYPVAVAANPDGTQFVAFTNLGLVFTDASLTPLAYVPGGDVGGTLYGGVYSRDGNKLYMILNSTRTPTVVTVNAAVGSALGTSPAIPFTPAYGWQDPPFTVAVPVGVDDTGIVFGIADHGVTFEDATYYQRFSDQVTSPNFNNTISPTSGPMNASTRISFWWGNPFAFVSDVWFGTERGLNPAFDGPSTLFVDAPPSAAPGPVNVKVIEPSGVMVFNPQAFSYGPSVIAVDGDTVGPSGGQTANLIGFGLPQTASQIQVSVGGAAANVLSAKRFTYGMLPAIDVTVQLPPGTPGSADLSVTTPSGSTTVSKAFTYVKAVNSYGAGNKYQAILLDRQRNVLYLSALDHVDVFSLTTLSFAPPITVRSVNGRQQLGGLALTPDSSTLLISNMADGSLAFVNPDAPASSRVVAVTPPSLSTNGCPLGPASVAATNTGKALVMTGSAPGIGCGPGGDMYTVDLSTLTVSPKMFVGTCSSYVYATRDGSKVAVSGSMSAFAGFCLYDSATATLKTLPDGQSFDVAGAAAGDGNRFAAMWNMLDPNLLIVNRMAFPDTTFSSALSAFRNVAPLQEIKLNDPGSLLFAPNAHSIDIFDTRVGVPLMRIALNETVPSVLDALAVNADGSGVYVISDAGVTIVELSALPVTVGSITPSSGTAGTQVKLRGTGFGPRTSVSFDGAAASVAFVDSSTLIVTVPGIAAGAAQMKIVNDAEEVYTIDRGFDLK